MLEAEYSTSLYQTIGGTNLPRIWLFGAGTEGQDCVPFNLILVFDSLDLSERAEVIPSVLFFFFPSFFFVKEKCISEKAIEQYFCQLPFNFAISSVQV